MGPLAGLPPWRAASASTLGPPRREHSLRVLGSPGNFGPPTMRRSTRHLPVAAILWPLFCLPGCSGSGAGAPASPASYTVTVSQDRPATIAQEQLTLSLVEVKDSRCPVGTQCIWAGHAAVTLGVGKTGGPVQPVVIGTE